MIPFQENSWIDTAMEGCTHTFIESFLLPPGFNKYLKVKDIEYDVDLTKNYYITVSMQITSSIHKLFSLYSRI